jgi:prolyl-tRNA synthetase
MSQYFLPTMKENPSEAQIVSHRLMLRAGLIRQTSAGIYAWLPLGLRVLKNIERIVREEQDRAAATTPTARRCCASRTGTTARCCSARPTRR